MGSSSGRSRAPHSCATVTDGHTVNETILPRQLATPGQTHLLQRGTPVDRELLDWEKEFNTGVNKIRYVIERVIANFKTWRIMHTDYRRPLDTFKETISAVVALQFYLAGE